MIKNPFNKSEGNTEKPVDAKPESTATPDSATKPIINLDKPVIKKAIAEGLAMIKDEKSKADAARAIYATIKDESKEVVVAAFVVGATLTEKGALTYWYNCKRQSKKRT